MCIYIYRPGAGGGLTPYFNGEKETFWRAHKSPKKLIFVLTPDIYGNRFRGYRVVESSCRDE